MKETVSLRLRFGLLLATLLLGCALLLTGAQRSAAAIDNHCESELSRCQVSCGTNDSCQNACMSQYMSCASHPPYDDSSPIQ